jgi:hypothetical protein
VCDACTSGEIERLLEAHRINFRLPPGDERIALDSFGFSIKFLADVVFNGLVTAEPSTT